MYDEITEIPEGATPEEIEKLRQYVMTSGEVAAALGVTQQAISQWTAAGTMPAHIEVKEDGVRPTYRYRLEDVVNVAISKGRVVKAWTLPFRLLNEYDITPLTNNPAFAELTAPEGTDVPVGWISESEAAKILGVRRSTLNAHRTRGLLNPAVKLRENPSPIAKGVQYEQASVIAVANGNLDLYA